MERKTQGHNTSQILEPARVVTVASWHYREYVHRNQEEPIKDISEPKEELLIEIT
ncbi:MAG: hypothetical protein QGG23_06030 [Candidatus Bathyarchaeota archaeon]|nr:hypothetical protein [Candidatus Bathyarchaeota archaeon]